MTKLTLLDLLSTGCILLVLPALVLGGHPPPEYRAECGVWANVTNTLMYDYPVPMNCDINQQCTGIDCTARFSYAGFYTLEQNFTQDFCFGLAIQPCTHPLKTNFYVETPGDTKGMYQHTLTHGTKLQLPGTHYSLGSLGSADGFVFITMNETYINGNRYVKLGVRYKTRITTLTVPHFPADLAFTLMPDTLVPVPPCQRDVETPPHDAGNCARYTRPTGTPGPGVPVWTTTQPPTQGNKTCTSELAQCPGRHEMCRPDLGRCVCANNYQRVGNQCKRAKATTPHPNIISEPDYSTGSDSSKLKIIIPVVIGGVVLIVGVSAAFVVVKYMRYRRRYGAHTVLLNEEEEDRDDDAAMVEA